MRYFIKFSYNGLRYHGWQIQPNAITVQETLSIAMRTILKYNIELMGAGRTDTGVHAHEMYAHFDFQKNININKVIHQLNSFLPPDIVVFDIFEVRDTAHARFDAKKRTYQYHIHNYKDAFKNGQSWYYQKDLDIKLMNEATKLLFNHIDFQCFSKSNTEVNTYNCKIYEAFWEQKNQNIIFTITADRFLRNMVRSIVGTLVYVGLKKITLDTFNDIILSKNRTKAGFSVPACGLFLTKIEYDL